MGLDCREISPAGFEASLENLRETGFSLTTRPNPNQPLITLFNGKRGDDEIIFGVGPLDGNSRRIYFGLPFTVFPSTRRKRERLYDELVAAFVGRGATELKALRDKIGTMEDTFPIRVQSLDHVTIVVKDLVATRRFYVEALGMDEVARPNFSFAGQWFQAGATLIHTILEFEGSSRAGLGGGVNTRGHHFAFLVEDAHKAARRIEALGIPFVSPPKLRPDGAVQLFLHDPDGHLVELTSVASRG